LEGKPHNLLKGKIGLILRLCVVVGAGYLIFRNLDCREFAAAFKQLRGWVICTAIAVKLVSEGGMAFRWWLLLRALSIQIPLKTAVRLHFHGLFFSSFLPTSTGGDFIRAWYVSRHTNKRVQSSLSVFVDRFTGLFSTALIAGAAYFLYFSGQGFLVVETKKISDVGGRYQAWFWLFLVFFLVFAVLFVLFRPTARYFLKRGFLIFREALRRVFIHIREIISVFLRKWWLFPLTVLITLFFQGLTIVSFWLIGLDLGVSGQLQYYFVFFPLVWVIGVIPVSIAGLGILEGGVVLLFVKAAGARAEAAAALAICQRALFLIGALPGIWVHLRADYLPKKTDHIFY
jgi:hypothetical protein